MHSRSGKSEINYFSWNKKDLSGVVANVELKWGFSSPNCNVPQHDQTKKGTTLIHLPILYLSFDNRLWYLFSNIKMTSHVCS